MHRREWMQSGLGMAGALFLAGRAWGEDPRTIPTRDMLKKLGPMMSKTPITTAEIVPGLHLIQGPGGNIAVLAGPDGSVVVDAGFPFRAQGDLRDGHAGRREGRLDPDQHALAFRPRGRERGLRPGRGEDPRHRGDPQATLHRSVLGGLQDDHPGLAARGVADDLADEFDLHVGDEALHLAAVPPATPTATSSSTSRPGT